MRKNHALLSIVVGGIFFVPAFGQNQTGFTNGASAPAPTPVVPEPATAAAEPEATEEVPPTLTDPLTGLFNEAFFRVTLDTRVSAARRHGRPLSVAIVKLETQNPSTSRGAIPAVSTSDLSAGPIHHCALSME